MSAASSMTGFGSVQGVAGGDAVGFTLTVRSVNHRFLDLQVRLPHRCEALELPLRAKVKERVRRGHVEVLLQMEQRVSGGLRLNRELLGEYVGAYRLAAADLGIGAEVDLNAMLRMPGVMTAEAALGPVDASELSEAVMEAMDRVLGSFNQARELEGTALVAELRAGMLRMQALTDEVLSYREEMRSARYGQVRERMKEILQGVTVPEERLLAEAALMADRSDVEEEMVRLRTHVERFQAMLEEGGELGKRLDFLVQEMNREANTLLSKTTGVGEGLRITEIGLAMKTEIERAKEQVQNLE